MRQQTLRNQFGWRFWFTIFLFLLAISALAWRLFDLTVSERTFLKNQGDARTIRTVTTPAYRGMITDRHGDPLAISTPVNAIWVNPKRFKLNDDNVNALAKILDLDPKALYKSIKKNKKRGFLYVKRQVNPSLANQVEALNIPAVFVRSELRRYYPSAEVSAQLIGFTNIDDIGQEGIELAYNQWLEGIPGKKRVVKDRLGRVIEELDIIREARPGNDLVLSIDRRIQYLAYRALKAGVEKFEAKSGSAIVLDVKTGEVLAMVNQPSFNPNNRPKIANGRYRNRALTDIFEPGSTMKTFSVAAALASGKYTPDTMINTAPGWMMIGRNEVKDIRDNGVINVTTVLQRSSNIGVSKLILSLPENTLRDLLAKLGFGQRTGIGFPGEENGYLPHYKKWKPFVLATFSFGYAMTSTNLQLAQGYMVLGNKGLKCPLSLLRVDKRPQCERVMSEKVSEQMLDMLEVVVEKSAFRAQVPGYRVGGKTGTVRIVGPNGYEKNRHIGMFVGMAPISDPQLLVSVVLKDPQGRHYYGSVIAAPVFAEIMSGSLRLINADPDKVEIKAE